MLVSSRGSVNLLMYQANDLTVDESRWTFGRYPPESSGGGAVWLHYRILAAERP